MDEKTYKNLKAVSAFLKSQGWKVSKSTVYEHSKARKIRPHADGLFYLADIEAYASTYLKKKDVPLTQTSDAIQLRRNEAEARKMEAQAQHWEVKAKVLSGAYVERETFERALAQRAMLFKYDLESFARSKAPEICRLVNGNNDLIPELVEHLLEQFAIFLNRYAEEREFVVPTPKNAMLDDIDGADENDAEFLDKTTESECH
ncbi:MAG: hypothetical protein ABFD75_07460 [Smithella sp.]